MGIAKDFNNVLHDQLHVLAAWLPVTNTFQLGDFGVISDGVFVRMGNVASDFGVNFESQAGQPGKLDFKSESVRVFRFAANASVAAFPGEDVDGALKIEFGKERSFYLKAGLTVTEIKSVFKAAQDLASKPRWDAGKFKVVSAVYNGTNCAILSSKESNASVEISGKTGALKRLELGAADAGLTFTSKTKMGLELLGETGIVGLSLFRVEKSGGAKFEADQGFTSSADWGATPPDDV